MVVALTVIVVLEVPCKDPEASKPMNPYVDAHLQNQYVLEAYAQRSYVADVIELASSDEGDGDGEDMEGGDDACEFDAPPPVAIQVEDEDSDDGAIVPSPCDADHGVVGHLPHEAERHDLASIPPLDAENLVKEVLT